jgi:hypothetical protein
MRRNLFLKKSLTGCVILLCISLSFIPLTSVRTTLATTDLERIEVTTEAYGIKGFGTTTVNLTRSEYHNLEQYLIEIKERLNQSTTKEEAALLFKDAAVELNAYGLLPKGMSVTQAQRLLTGYHYPSISSLMIQNNMHMIMKSKTGYTLDQTTKNVLCFLSATLHKIPEYTPSPFIISLGILLVLGLGPALLLSLIGADDLAKQLIDLELVLWSLNPFRLFNFILFMGYDVSLSSIGLKGLVISNYAGGGLFTGYSGLMLNPFGDTSYFLGFALRVDSLS